jgi:ABC-2 type transport system ATP-binding protein
VDTRADGAMMVQGLEAPSIGKLAAEGGLVLYELTPQEVSLEEAFMELTHDAVEYEATPYQHTSHA